MAKVDFAVEPGKQEIVITQLYNAPRELVFKAYTDPNLISKWWGPKRYTTIVDKMDVRPGGIWRFINRDKDGAEYAFHGVYHEVSPPMRLVYTFEFEGMPGHVSFETVMLEEQDGKTKVTDKVVFQSVEDRDMMVKTGMKEGATESMERFSELLTKFSGGKRR
jgi:uncharacterized protein YndB with AHSA1/START domain